MSAAKAAGTRCVAVAITHVGEDLAGADLTAVGRPLFS